MHVSARLDDGKLQGLIEGSLSGCVQQSSDVGSTYDMVIELMLLTRYAFL